MQQFEYQPLDWYWFKGNDVKASILQGVCRFRSYVLYGSGFRKNFGTTGKNFGDTYYTDFESYHIVAAINNVIIGTVRITPPNSETVGLSILGDEKYSAFLKKIDLSFENIVEINRLMVDDRFRSLKLGQTLMHAAVALTEKIWNLDHIEILGTAGNCTKQVDFFVKHTDYRKIEGLENFIAPEFNDEVTLLKYGKRPYNKGAKQIDEFVQLFNLNDCRPTLNFKSNYDHSLFNEMTV